MAGPSRNELLGGKVATADQIEFIALIVEELNCSRAASTRGALVPHFVGLKK